jgi:hypothetical protein
MSYIGNYTSNISNRALLVAAAAMLFHINGEACAQISDELIPPKFQSTDAAGVDLISGQYVGSAGTIKIGPVDGTVLSYTSLPFSGGGDEGTPLIGEVQKECYSGSSSAPCPIVLYHFRMGQEMESGICVPYGRTCNMSTWTQTTTEFKLVKPDGTEWTFAKIPGADNQPYYSGMKIARVSKVTLPNGEILQYTYGQFGLSSVTSTRGYQLHIQNNGGLSRKVTLINLSSDYCDPAGNTCAGLTANWPSTDISMSGASAQSTDSLGRVTSTTGWQPLSATRSKITMTSPSGISISIISEIQNASTVSAICPAKNFVKELQNSVGTWSYSYTFYNSCLVSAVSTDPAGGLFRYSINNDITTIQDPLDRITKYTLSANQKVKKVIYPGLNEVNIKFDPRENPTEVSRSPGPSSSLAAIISTVSFPDVCPGGQNDKICNKPLFTIDARGARTDYTYSADHGGILTKTLPADANGIRPQLRYNYQQKSARYKIAANQFAYAPPIWLVSSISQCRSQATCGGTADEIITSYTYNDNLLPDTETITTGNSGVSRVITMTYDGVGNLVSLDGPTVGAADTTYYFFDGVRNLTGQIGPDPDGTGPLLRPAKRLSYSNDGKLTFEEQGTVAGVGPADLAGMVVSNFYRNIYNPVSGRLEKTESGKP